MLLVLHVYYIVIVTAVEINIVSHQFQELCLT